MKIVCIILIFASIAWLYATRFREGFGLSTRVTCPTRNMSYDLRGDPFIIPRYLEMSEIGILEKDMALCESHLA